MIRTPLRPLARILRARDTGENPDTIERENLRLRLEQMRDSQRQRAGSRLLVLTVMFFLCAFGIVGAPDGLAGRNGSVRAAQARQRRRRSCRPGRHRRPQRAHSGHQHGNAFPVRADRRHDRATARGAELAAIFPDLDAEAAGRAALPPRAVVLLDARRLSPEQMQAVHDIGGRACCSPRARCGCIPTARWPRMCWAARASGARACTRPR